MKGSAFGPQSVLGRLIVALLLFAIAYAVINFRYLLHLIVYAPMTHFYARAAWAAVGFSMQALLLLTAIVLLPRMLFAALLALFALSAYVNLAYDQILGETLDLGRMGWLVSEWRQAGEAAGAFTTSALVALAKLILVLALFVLVRRLLRPLVRGPAARLSLSTPLALALGIALAVPVVAIELTARAPVGAERNVYTFAAAIARAEPPPERQTVPVEPVSTPVAEKIVWLIDESIAYETFGKLVAPQLEGLDAVDFGETASLSSCSASANLALRSGVDVLGVGHKSDLRESPSIWGYANAAGFHTVLIDGQKRGRPQNFLQKPERGLIDELAWIRADHETDREIAREINKRLATPGREFIYVLLRGAHYDYGRHYPDSAVPRGRTLSLLDSYELAVSYSKRDFFTILLEGIDRDSAAVIYTSDHGQNIDERVPPHCSGHPVDSEFAVPLVTFLPRRVAAELRRPNPSGHAHSQIFPTTLALMGYASDYAESAYDNTLRAPTKRYVWFGRAVLPGSDEAKIDLHTSPGFPLRDETSPVPSSQLRVRTPVTRRLDLGSLLHAPGPALAPAARTRATADG